MSGSQKEQSGGGGNLNGVFLDLGSPKDTIYVSNSLESASFRNEDKSDIYLQLEDANY